ncbi:gluconokinase [Infirmifilum lucidum]|uniref:Gluconokinase n=1 Tax=Infirmifilum lucidum TaxID=2776706 RepID=A0A7L9FK57_9CREN|nr:gluconokinase [Infirmifilum lucidum]QOJ79185.1 gluconokinase [Infirmifilum lucidum]
MYFLATDVGTTTLKVSVIDEKSNFLFYKTVEIPVLRAEHHAAEHDPEFLLRVFLELAREAVSSSKVKIDALVFSGYLFGLVGIDPQGEPLTGILTWLDRRPVEILGEMYSKVQPPLVYEKTGCPPLYIYQLAKIYWLYRRKPEIYRRTAYFVDVRGYLIYRLTGKVVFEKSSASGSQLLNMAAMEWDSELLEELGLDESKLPELVEGDRVVGELKPEVARLIGLEHSVPVIPGIFDGGSVAVGEGALSNGAGSSHLSTSTMLRVATHTPIVDKVGKMRFQTYYACEGIWLPGGALNNAGILLKWFRDNFAQLERIVSEETGINVYDLITLEASEAPAGAGGLVFIPYILGERIPEFGNEASGVLFGLREYHTRAHVVRSLLEGVAYNLKLVKEALAENSLHVREVRITGGGAGSDLWLQIIADVLEVPIHRIQAKDAALWGATILGMKALGQIRDVKTFAQSKAVIAKTFVPNEKNINTYRGAYNLFKLLLERIKPVYLYHASQSYSTI